MRAVKFPSQGTVFDYYVDPNTKKFTPWSERTPPYEQDPDVPLQVRYSSHAVKHNYMAKLSILSVWYVVSVEYEALEFSMTLMINSKFKLI